jgi:hypothetical protein
MNDKIPERGKDKTTIDSSEYVRVLEQRDRAWIILHQVMEIVKSRMGDVWNEKVCGLVRGGKMFEAGDLKEFDEVITDERRKTEKNETRIQDSRDARDAFPRTETE